MAINREKLMQLKNTGIGNSSKRDIISRMSVPLILDVSEIEEYHAQQRKTNNLITDESIKELAQDIKLHGLINPITVAAIQDHETGTRRYMLVAGSRRLAAYKSLNLARIPVMVYDLNAKDPNFEKDLYILSDAENSKRLNLSIMEDAEAIVYMNKELGISLEEIAKYRNIALSSVYKFMQIAKFKKQLVEILSRYNIDIYSVRNRLFLYKLIQAIVQNVKHEDIDSIVKAYIKEIDNEGDAQENYKTTNGEIETVNDNTPQENAQEKPKVSIHDRKPKNSKQKNVYEINRIKIDKTNPYKIVIDCKKAPRNDVIQLFNALIDHVVNYTNYEDNPQFVDFVIDNSENIAKAVSSILEASFEDFIKNQGGKGSIVAKLHKIQ